LAKHHLFTPKSMGRRVAHVVRGAMLDYVEFEDGFAMVKTRPPKEAVGKALGDTGIRARHHVTVVAVKRQDRDWDYTTTQTVLHEDDEIIVAGATAERFASLL
jgi:trk system potassium uptake protein TrkA